MSRNNAERLHEEGVKLYQEGRLSEAIVLHRRAAEEDETWALPLLSLGVACLQSGHEEQALGAFQQGFPLAEGDDERAVFLSNMGQAYHKLGNLERAIDSYRRSLGFQEAPTTWVEMGMAWHSLGQNEKAIQCLRTYLENPVEEIYPSSEVRALLASYGGSPSVGGMRPGCCVLLLLLILLVMVAVN